MHLKIVSADDVRVCFVHEIRYAVESIAAFGYFLPGLIEAAAAMVRDGFVISSMRSLGPWRVGRRRHM